MPTVEADVVADVADRLFAAIEKRRPAPVEAALGRRRRWSGRREARGPRRNARCGSSPGSSTTTERRYEILDRQFFDGGFVQQHILHANGRNGGSISMRVCIVIKLGANGLINRIDEYFDPQKSPHCSPSWGRTRRSHGHSARTARQTRHRSACGTWSQTGPPSCSRPNRCGASCRSRADSASSAATAKSPQRPNVFGRIDIKAASLRHQNQQAGQASPLAPTSSTSRSSPTSAWSSPAPKRPAATPSICGHNLTVKGTTRRAPAGERRGTRRRRHAGHRAGRHRPPRTSGSTAT